MPASGPSGGTATPAVGAPPETKRRSRRGCIPCRRRHRKCDEQRPKCGSCKARNVACAYKPLTWVSDAQSLLAETNGTNNGIVRSRPSYQSLPTTTHVSTPSSASLVGAEPQETTAVAADRINFDGSSVLDRTTPTASPIRGILNSDRTVTTHPRTKTGLENSENLASTLRTFRYDIAPIIDSGAPRSSFAVNVLDLAQTEDVIMQAVILVVERRSAHTQSPQNYQQSDARSRELLADLSTKDAFTAHIGYSLLALRSFFGRPPSEWSNIRLEYPRGESSDLPLQTINEPLQSLARFQIKIELAHSLRTNVPLSEELLSWVQHHPMSAFDSSPQVVANASICHLARCVNLVNSRQSIFPAEHAGPLSGQTPDSSSDDFESAWSAYWAICTHWYQTRSQDMVPILETTALEAAVLTTDGPGFPVSIHTSPISLQSNVTMHLACLLLLKHRPGLSAVIRPQQPFESRSWHSEKIAGNAVWNTYKEQWDPILLGALLLIAEEMTHQAQQLAIRDCLQRISREAGVDLQREMVNLNSIWQSFREDLDIDFDY